MEHHVFPFLGISPLRLAISVAILAALTVGQAAAGDKSSHPFFRYPSRPLPGEYLHLIQVGAAKLPEDVVEAASSLIRAPLFEYQAMYGFQYGLSLAGGLSTNIVTFHIALGPRWQTEIDPFTVAVGYDVAYWFGQIKSIDGFDTSVRGWLNYPNVSLGYRIEDIAITVRGDMILSTHLGSFVGDTEVASDRNTIAGYSIALYVEQPLWEDNFVLLGIKSNYTKIYYPLWAAFSTFNRHYYIPELIFGFIL